MFSAQEIVRLHDECTRRWHVEPPRLATNAADLRSAIEQQHLANFELWHEEDKARTPGAQDHEIANVKRNIDRFNQRRNDLMELCDSLALEELKKTNLPNAEATLHSESIGLMIDRLSILALKIFHTRQEIGRENAPAGHAERNRERLATLDEQRHDLVEAFDGLWQEILAGKKRFKIYRQLKMYNEPSLNPLIYEAGKR